MLADCYVRRRRGGGHDGGRMGRRRPPWLGRVFWLALSSAVRTLRSFGFVTYQKPLCGQVFRVSVGTYLPTFVEVTYHSHSTVFEFECAHPLSLSLFLFFYFLVRPQDCHSVHSLVQSRD
jgi:hypothetical protein